MPKKSSRRSSSLRPPKPSRRRRPTILRRAARDSAVASTPARPRDPQLEEGIALFNAHQFFKCHEVLEQRWLTISDGSKDFYKGLIQAAVAFYHWSRDNPAGALTLASSARRYLTRYGPVYGGVDLESFLPKFSELFQWLRRHRMRYDPRLVPVIRLTDVV